MNFRIFFLALILLAGMVMVPVSATVTNTTELVLSSAGFYKSVSVNAGSTNLYDPSSDNSYNPSHSKYSVIASTYSIKNDASSVTTRYTFSSGNTVDVVTTAVTTGTFSAEYRITSSAGTTTVIPYTLWIPWSGSNAPTLRTRLMYGNQTQKWYLFTGLADTTANPFDTSSNAYAEVSSPGYDPIVTVNQYSVSGGTLDATYHAVPVTELPKDAQVTVSMAASGQVTESWPEILVKALGAIYSAAAAMISFGTYIASLFNITTAFFIFFTSAQFFVGFNAVYLAINILLAIEDADDIFRAFNSIVRREMKLFRFYSEIFLFIKEMIKWW